MIKNFGHSILIFTVLSLTSIAVFAECRQANLKSTDGSEINISYSSNNETNGSTAWLNPTVHVVLSAEKCAAKQVVVQLVSSQFGYSYAVPQTLNYDGQGCSYSATMNNYLYANHGGVPTQQIAVQIIYANGSEWLVNPAGNVHNFNYAFRVDGYSPLSEICK
jgi:hypothetical protein